MPETESAEGDLVLEVSADEAHAQAVAQASRAIMAHPVARHEFPGGDLWLVSLEQSDKDEASSRFAALVQDTGSGRLLLARGRLGEGGAVTMTPVAEQRSPGGEEFAWAVSVLAEDDEAGALAGAEGFRAYRPLPPLANVVNADGTVDRVITVGIRAQEGGEADPSVPRHRLLGVRSQDGSVVREPLGAPAEWADDCGTEPGPECPPQPGPAQAWVRVRRGDRALWDLLVVRPSTSSGTNGSGVELRRVDYKGQRVLARAHIPILTGRCRDEEPGPGCAASWRAWLYEESCFTAVGSDPVPGFRVCSAPPATALDGNSAAADGDTRFRGVALWLDGEDLVIMSQLQAGWYRYVTEWRLAADGIIRPRFGAAAVHNPCTCRPHVHDVYWRFDVDVLGDANNQVQEHNDPPVISTSKWHTTRYEVRRPWDPSGRRFWRVRNVRSAQGYSLVPGPDDGDAAGGGEGDVWILRYQDSEIDDGQGFTTDPTLSPARLDRFVNSESVERHDVVVWYAAHLPSGATDGPAEAPRIGPELVPFHWRDPVEQEAFAPPEPPPRPS